MGSPKTDDKKRKLRQGVKMFCLRIHDEHCDTCCISKANRLPTSLKKYNQVIREYCDTCVDKKCHACLFKLLVIDVL